MGPLRLRELSLGARLGLTGVVLALLLGLWASLEHLRGHHQNRDGAPGVSLDDVRGAYHGLKSPASLVSALERGHPETLETRERELLLAWLRGGKVSEQYDDPDLGDASPAEIVARGCLACHARKAGEGDGIGETLPLDYWDDVKKLAFSREIDALPESVLAASTHAHAIALGTTTLILGALLLATRFAAWIKGSLCALAGLSLIADLASWWLARSSESFVLVIVVAGGAWFAAATLSSVLVLAELWLPRPRS